MRKKKRNNKMNQKDVIHMTKNQEVQENMFIMMAVSDPGVFFAIMIYFFNDI